MSMHIERTLLNCLLHLRINPLGLLHGSGCLSRMLSIIWTMVRWYLCFILNSSHCNHLWPSSGKCKIVLLEVEGVFEVVPPSYKLCFFFSFYSSL